MEKYIINNKTIALIKKKNETLIYNVDKVYVFNKNINKIIDYSCNYYGSSLEGRKISAKNILNIRYKLPILIDEENNITLIQLNSPRKSNCIFLVTNKIVDYEEKNGILKIKCVNNVNFYVKITKNTFEKMLIKSMKLNNILFWRKNTNFL